LSLDSKRSLLLWLREFMHSGSIRETEVGQSLQTERVASSIGRLWYKRVKQISAEQKKVDNPRLA
jgi:hypothetical protein